MVASYLSRVQVSFITWIQFGATRNAILRQSDISVHIVGSMLQHLKVIGQLVAIIAF
jgi:hypothetical protein